MDILEEEKELLKRSRENARLIISLGTLALFLFIAGLLLDYFF